VQTRLTNRSTISNKTVAIYAAPILDLSLEAS